MNGTVRLLVTTFSDQAESPPRPLLLAAPSRLPSRSSLLSPLSPLSPLLPAPPRSTVRPRIRLAAARAVGAQRGRVPHVAHGVQPPPRPPAHVAHAEQEPHEERASMRREAMCREAMCYTCVIPGIHPFYTFITILTSMYTCYYMYIHLTHASKHPIYTLYTPYIHPTYTPLHGTTP